MKRADGELILFWTLPALAVIWISAFFLFPGFVQPMSPTMSAQSVAAFYGDPQNLPRIRYSMILFNWFGVGLIPVLMLLVIRIRRMGRRPDLRRRRSRTSTPAPDDRSSATGPRATCRRGATFVPAVHVDGGGVGEAAPGSAPAPRTVPGPPARSGADCAAALSTGTRSDHSTRTVTMFDRCGLQSDELPGFTEVLNAPYLPAVDQDRGRAMTVPTTQSQ